MVGPGMFTTPPTWVMVLILLLVVLLGGLGLWKLGELIVWTFHHVRIGVS